MSSSQHGIARPGAPLPVPQVRESHDLHLDVMGVPTTVQVVVPPYPGMAVGDAVTFTFAPPFGLPGWERQLPVEPGDEGKALTWALPQSSLLIAEGLDAEFFYVVARGDGASENSPVQVITLLPPERARLPVAQLPDEPGVELDPSLHPEGLAVVVPLDDLLALDDVVLVHWQGAQSSGSTLIAAPVTQEALEAGALTLRLEPRWLEANIGGSVTLQWQFAREGVALSSEALSLGIVAPLRLDPPVVDKAQPEGAGLGYLDADKGFFGVYVDVPASAPVTAEDSLAMHWDGHPAGGQHVAEAPHSPENPLRFQIPAAAVPANMGGEAKRLDVFYRLTRPGGRVHTSDRFRLRVRPLAQGDYPPPKCPLAEGRPGIGLADVPSGGLWFQMTGFSFAAPGHLLTLWVTGLSSDGTSVQQTVRDAMPITPVELEAKAMGAAIPREFLETLRPNFDFNLRARVSFDAGETFFTTPSSNVHWLG